jgi:hypothetical protein
MYSLFDSIRLSRAGQEFLVGADKANGWSWPAHVEAECRRFSKAAVSGLLGLTTAFDSKQTISSTQYSSSIADITDYFYSGKYRDQLPHRVAKLENALDYIASQQCVWSASAGEILDCWKQQQ